MRTTIDLDQKSYSLAKAVAEQKKVSLGKVLAEAIVAQYGSPVQEGDSIVGRSAAGFPTLRTGFAFTSDFVSEVIDD